MPAIRALIPLSVRGLNGGLYSPAQLEAALAHLFGADTQLLEAIAQPLPGGLTFPLVKMRLSL